MRPGRVSASNAPTVLQGAVRTPPLTAHGRRPVRHSVAHIARPKKSAVKAKSAKADQHGAAPSKSDVARADSSAPRYRAWSRGLPFSATLLRPVFISLNWAKFFIQLALVWPAYRQVGAATFSHTRTLPRRIGLQRSVFLPPSPRALGRTEGIRRRLADRRAPSRPVRFFYMPPIVAIGTCCRPSPIVAVIVRSFPPFERVALDSRPSHFARERLSGVCGAGWRVRTTFLGAVRSLWELSLPSPVGFGTRRPPTYVGARDQRPTAFSAPRCA